VDRGLEPDQGRGERPPGVDEGEEEYTLYVSPRDGAERMPFSLSGVVAAAAEGEGGRNRSRE
jgi:hypothetical protein